MGWGGGCGAGASGDGAGSDVVGGSRQLLTNIGTLNYQYYCGVP